ncbi:MAG: hypothetical protein ACOYJ1_06035, partial [Peptococcales bacterium]
VSFYDKKRNNSCNLAFIYNDVCQEICFAVNEKEGEKDFAIVADNPLTYIGDGTIAILVQKIATNELFNYKISFSHEGLATINFKVVAETTGI